MKRFNSLWETIKEGADEAYESVTDKGEEMFDDMKSSWDIWINEKMNPVHTCAEPVKETEEDSSNPLTDAYNDAMTLNEREDPRR